MFLEEFTNSLLSIVAARSNIEQGKSCFYPGKIFGGDKRTSQPPLGLLFDGLLERGWIRGGEIEGCRVEYQSFAQEQRQLEWSSMMSRPEVDDDLSFC